MARRRRVSASSIIGHFPSLKAAEDPSVPYESTIERDLLYYLEFDPTVIKYRMQPFTITMPDAGGITHDYTPDCEVSRTNCLQIVECKPQALLDDEHTRRQVEMGERWASENNCEFILITDIDLRTGHKLKNLKILWRYARLPVPTQIQEQVITFLRLHPDGVSFAALAGQLAGDAPPLSKAPYLYRLLFQHILEADLTQPLTPETVVRLASGIG